MNLLLLTHDVLPLHATALEVDGNGLLVTGWSKGGKTETFTAATRWLIHRPAATIREWASRVSDLARSPPNRDRSSSLCQPARKVGSAPMRS